MTQPYPMFIAGTPLSWSFDAEPSVKIFDLTYVPATSGPTVTEIFVPDRHYPDGFTVNFSTGATVTTDGQMVMVTASGSIPEVSVRIFPKDPA